MKKQHLISLKYPISWALILFALYLTSLYSYLLFHSIAEIFSIVVACGIFMIMWNSRRFIDNSFLLFIGIAYLFIACLDLAHTLAYTGMGVFPSASTNLAAQLWIAARYIEGISFLIALIFLHRKLKVTFVLIGYVIAVFLLLSSIIWNIFPECFNEVIGLTPFKKISEYIISLILFTSAVLLIRMRSSFETDIVRLLVASIILTIASEISFTLYTQAYGHFNLIGHYFKIISFYLIYKAFIQTGLVKPFNLLFRNLRQGEEMLRKSEARYRGMVEDQTELICRFTPDGTLTFVNVAYCRYFGKKGDELVGHKFMSFIPEDEQKAVEEHFASFSRENPVATHELHAIAPSGEICWQQWTNRAIYDEQGHLIEFQSVGRDITKRKLAEEALRESEEKYRSMMEAMNYPVYICSQDFRVTYMNPAMIQRTGRDATGEPCYKVVHELDEKCPWCVHERIQQGECCEIELVSPKDDRSYHVSHSPIFHVDGSISKMTIWRDISQEKQAKEALRKARDELEQRVKERTAELSKSNVLLRQEIAERKQAEEALQRTGVELRRLSSQLLNAQEEERKRIARELHDGIGQSLSAIKFKVEAALNGMGQEDPAQLVQSLETVVPVAQGAVEEVRRISRNLRPPILDELGVLATISWLCREVETIYSGIRIEKEINVQENEVPDQLKIVIFRVLQESFNNIAKHSQADLVRFSLSKVYGKIEIAIDDNGVGFDVEQVLSGEQSKRGIGLAGMKERTELSGGSFTVESQKGAGTTIRVSLPLS